VYKDNGIRVREKLRLFTSFERAAVLHQPVLNSGRTVEMQTIKNGAPRLQLKAPHRQCAEKKGG